MQYRHRYTRGFTLIELLVVLLILGMIAGIAGPQIMNYLGESKAKAAKLQISEFEGTLDLYKLDVGRYPDSQEGLQALVQAPASAGDRWQPLPQEEGGAQGPLGQRLPVRRARQAWRCRHRFLRRRRQGRRRRRKQGHRELGMMPARRHGRGFTLIELLVVLLLLGIVYALAGPMLDVGGSGVDVKAATRQLAAGLRKARGTAIAEGRDATLTLQVEARRFSVSGDPKVYGLPGSVALSLFTARSEVVGGDSGSIRFHADGSSTGGRITVSVGDAKQSVDVDWLTGRVKIL
jgi:general secretion pathway protein H